ncbi:hypothetical protein RNZ50_16850 [Paracoccaceae bacterium Fryx2]|nr:hypothetical protein [Paracoccaceae bacterium Fryx2]
MAAWSSFYIASEDKDPAVVATAPASDAPLPGVDEEMLADLQDPAEFPEAGADPAAAESAGPVAAPETLDITADPAPPTDTVVEAAPGVTAPAAGEATAFAPAEDAQDEIFLTTVEPAPPILDPIALPQPDTLADALPGPQQPPPPFGTLYQFDANGFIQPTEAGVVTPEGVTLIAGRPSVVPPPRPAALDVPAAAPAATLPEAAAEPAEFPSDPELAGARPRARPAGLAPPAPVQAEDDAALTPETDARVTSLRPRPRPTSMIARAEEARRATEAATLSALAEAVQPDPATEISASSSSLAVAVSRTPAARPKDFSKAVEAAVAVAVRPTARVAPPADPEEEDEPEVAASAAPKIPIRASLAKQATFANAINLSKTNLIGVYGTASSRYALIRQSNGRYKKVKVGDSVDGGRVAAITASEVRYQKNGKMITLAMPKG